MDIRNLKTFVYVAELNSFTRAGEQLGYSQSTISFQIRQLEKELNAPLFDRVNHTVTLTGPGREVLRYAHQIIQLSQELETSLKQEKQVSGHIRLAMADSLCPVFFQEGFKQFRQQYPGITLKLVTAGTEEMFRLLNHNETDLVVTLDNHIYHTEYVIAQEKKISTHFVANAAHPLAARSSLTVEELLDYPFLMTEKGMSYRRLMDEKLAARSLEVIPVLELGNTDQICRLVEQDAGIAFLPDYVTRRAVEAGKIRHLPVVDFEVEVWLQLLYHRNKWVSPAMERVMEYCMGIKM